MLGLVGARLAVRTLYVDHALLPIHIVVGDAIYIGQRISSRLDGRHANRCADRQGLIAYRGKTETKILFRPSADSLSVWGQTSKNSSPPTRIGR